MTAANTLVTCWTIFVLNFTVVMLRIAVRIRRRKQSLAIGDYLVLAALFSSLVGYSLFTRGLNNQIVFDNMTTGANSSIQGGGEQSRRLLAAGLPVLQQALKELYITTYFYLFTLWLVKAAFIQFYFEIFPYIKKWLRVALWITTVWTISGFIVVFFMMLFWCHPRSLSWNPLKQCNPTTEMTPFVVLTVANLSSDLMISLLPLFVLSTLQLRRRENTALIFIFGIGAVSITATIARCVLIIGITNGLTPKKTSGMNIMIWSTIEMGAALVAVCLPAMRVLLWRPEPGSTWWGGKSSAGGSKMASWGNSSFKKSQSDVRSNPSSRNTTKGEPSESLCELQIYPSQVDNDAV
ncbi:hypothetical protein Q9L58_008966 [Maublancomyces gigas]|uniref:Rhodopsin domain-containing protein n=1 Tax=Discina gigas TaxID=1032678 RepID=A0ABR3G895_9PEZI